MESNEYDVVSNQVLELVANSTLSTYDCEFVALARDIGIKVVTTDKRILKIFPVFAYPLTSLSNSSFAAENFIQPGSKVSQMLLFNN